MAPSLALRERVAAAAREVRPSAVLAIVIGLIAAVANAAERTGTRTSYCGTRVDFGPIRERLKASRSV